MTSPEQNLFGISYVVPPGREACLNPDDNLLTVDQVLTYRDTLTLLCNMYGNEEDGVLPDNFGTMYAATVANYFQSTAILRAPIRSQLNITE